MTPNGGTNGPAGVEDVLRTEQISMSFGPVVALQNVDLHLKRGELLGLVADLPRRRRLGATVRTACAGTFRRVADTANRWTRKTPAPLMLPAGPQRRFTIGREADCDLTLAEETVSRWHASLVQADGSWLLDDLGSTNGTRVNGWRVTGPTPVAPGDCVSFGRATFVIRTNAGPARFQGRAA